MAPRPPKPCRKAGCNALSREANGFCPAHQEFAAELERQRQRRGDDRRESASKRGYDRKWQALRKSFLRCNPFCKKCEENGQTVLAECVHHINEDAWDRRDGNLMSLCFNCHERLHGRVR